MARVLFLGPLLAAAACGGPTAAPDAGDLIPPDAAPPRVDAAPLPPQPTRLRIVNRCPERIWIAQSDNVPGAPNVPLAPGAFHDYAIPEAGLAAARFWPKLGCDESGHACAIGDTGEGGGAPCGPDGCHPPVDSKFEVTFAPAGSADATFYNLSLVDGYTLPFTVTPKGPGAGVGGCTASDCSQLTVDACPSGEDLGGDLYPEYAGVDLRLRDPADPARTLACVSPCKAWSYPAPYGLGRPESEDPGLHLCCPTPIDPASGACTAASGCISPEACRDPGDPLSVEHTDFVALVRARCPTAYSYSYDDAAGLHACPADAAFEVVFCP